MDGDVEDGGAEEAEEGEEDSLAAGFEEGVGGRSELLGRRPVLSVVRIRGAVVGMVKGGGVHVGCSNDRDAGVLTAITLKGAGFGR